MPLPKRKPITIETLINDSSKNRLAAAELKEEALLAENSFTGWYCGNINGIPQIRESGGSPVNASTLSGGGFEVRRPVSAYKTSAGISFDGITPA